MKLDAIPPPRNSCANFWRHPLRIAKASLFRLVWRNRIYRFNIAQIRSRNNYLNSVKKLVVYGLHRYARASPSPHSDGSPFRGHLLAYQDNTTAIDGSDTHNQWQDTTIDRHTDRPILRTRCFAHSRPKTIHRSETRILTNASNNKRRRPHRLTTHQPFKEPFTPAIQS